MIEEDMLRWLHNNGTPEAVKLIKFEEAEEYSYCGEGTCVYDLTVVRMYYLDSSGNEDYDWYEGELTEFIKELTDAR